MRSRRNVGRRKLSPGPLTSPAGLIVKVRFMSDSSAQTLFVALEPDAETIERIWRYKRQTERLAGPQLYLDHPPHMTLYVGVFASLDAVLEATRVLAANWTAPTLMLDGWQTFLGDALTGNNTLTLKFAEADCERLQCKP